MGEFDASPQEPHLPDVVNAIEASETPLVAAKHGTLLGRFNYSDQLDTASIVAGGSLVILIPPSVVLVIYGILTETSIGKLFMAGIIPGLMGILFYLGAVRWTAWRRPDAGPASQRTAWPERGVALKSVWAVLPLFFLVIGDLYGLFDFEPLNLTFSPTEAASMGATGAFITALSRGGLDCKGVTPFWIADIIRLTQIVALTILVLFLPNQMGGLGH